MGAWLSKVLHPFSAEVQPDETVYHTLETAQRMGTKISLEANSDREPLTMKSTIEHVREDGLIISQPIVNSEVCNLPENEPLKIGFVHEGLYFMGETECLGEVQITSSNTSVNEQGNSILAYRLAMPERLEAQDRRREPRVQIGSEMRPDAELQIDGSENSLCGQIVDLSLVGARIRLTKSPDQLTSGQSVTLKAQFPPPTGSLEKEVELARIDFEPGTGQYVVGIKFHDPIPGLEEVIEGLSWVRSHRRRAG